MNRLSITLGFIFIAVFVSFGLGCWLYSNNPEGIWINTPPVDGTGRPADALYVGAFLGCLVIGTIYLVGAIGIFSLVKLKEKLPNLLLPLVVAAVSLFALLPILSKVAG